MKDIYLKQQFGRGISDCQDTDFIDATQASY